MAPEPLEVADRAEIGELMARYGNIIDERQFSRIGEVFIPDARYDVADFGLGVIHGAGAIVDAWTRTTDHPLAHHVTNVEISQDGDGTVRVISKIIGVGHKGRVGSATYRDIVVMTDDGWRIAARIVSLRRGDRVPTIS